LKASDAAQRLRDSRLVPRILLVTSSRGEGTVLGQMPAAHTNIDVGSAVQLRVAKAPAGVLVPSLVGWTAAIAKDRLRSLGLHWSVTAKASSESHNTVLAQSPSPGARIAIGTTIRPTLSLGLAQVSVPDVKGLDEASARARLGDVAIDDQPTSDPSKDGVVVDQTPTSTSSAPKGSTVTITVARLG
jgi:beta-lactam-binding protein with PASTA domain